MSTVDPLPARIERLEAFDQPVVSARYVDHKRAAVLAGLGVKTVGDLLYHLPFRYLDLTSTPALRDVRAGMDVTVVGRVHSVTVRRPRPRLAVTEVALADGTGVVLGVWFNQPWVEQRFAVGESVAFAGRVEFDYGMYRIANPFVEKVGEKSEQPVSGRVLAVHHTGEGLSTAWLRRLIAAAVDDYAEVPDFLPTSVRVTHGLVPLATALHDVHLPETLQMASAARYRLVFDELFVLQVFLALRRHAATAERAGVRHIVDGVHLKRLQSEPPFLPTEDQARAIAEILGDMAGEHPMNRMLLGDVGTGKTFVALHALAAVADTGSQAAMLAPTEVLAAQYSHALGPLLDALGISWALLTGGTPAAERRDILGGTRAGAVTILFGTHALLEESVQFDRLTLAIVDEQHRFGVRQRLGLRAKGASADLLVMTATPIPRSLALALYGDLAMTTLRQRPNTSPGTRTFITSHSESAGAMDSVRSAVRSGRQAYVVCALVDESSAAQARAATREVERLRSHEFVGLRVGLLTGRMSSGDKRDVMAAFRAGDIDILVSTTVIEVGVDVPNATVMVIEDAERFGLAQLHQLRGRVGRGDHAGEVWLVSDSRSPESRKRLEILRDNADGFAVAEEDLRLRGEGQLLGDRQHGMPDLRVASLIDDLETLAVARKAAFQLVTDDPQLAHPIHGPLRRLVHARFKTLWEWVSAG